MPYKKIIKGSSQESLITPNVKRQAVIRAKDADSTGVISSLFNWKKLALTELNYEYFTCLDDERNQLVWPIDNMLDQFMRKYCRIFKIVAETVNASDLETSEFSEESPNIFRYDEVSGILTIDVAEGTYDIELGDTTTLYEQRGITKVSIDTSLYSDTWQSPRQKIVRVIFKNGDRKVFSWRAVNTGMKGRDYIVPHVVMLDFEKMEISSKLLKMESYEVQDSSH